MAIKEIGISNNSNISKDMKIKIDEEIEILKDLKHENVVRFIGSQKNFKTIYLFFEYISGSFIFFLKNSIKIKKKGAISLH